MPKILGSGSQSAAVGALGQQCKLQVPSCKLQKPSCHTWLLTRIFHYYLLVGSPDNWLPTVEPVCPNGPQGKRPKDSSHLALNIYTYVYLCLCVGVGAVCVFVIVFYAYCMIDCVLMHIENWFLVASETHYIW